ncbi:hypothetical protein L7F22_057281 [Adiantum nelumboides]|nr:hypothetical protein [Adiantum nelumboides]
MKSLTPVVNYILEGEFPKEFTTGQRRKLIKQASTFLWLEGSLHQKGKDLVCRTVPSTNEIPKILKGLHEEACGGHFSHELTLKKVLLAGYVWPSMHADVQHWCRSCHNCQVNGNKKLLYGPRQAVIANGPFEKWGIDAMGPLPRTANGKLYILVAIDYMTRWVEAQSVAKVNEKTVSKFVYTHICCRFGTPLEIVSDNGPGFRRGLLTEVCEELKISHRHSTPYYPQSNGLVEKANGIIAGIIRKMVESKPKRWDNFLDGAIWAYKTTYRDATQFTPFHLVYGQEALQPIELNIPTIKLTGRQEQSNDEAWIDRLLNLVELEWKRKAAYHCYQKKALQLKDKLNEGIKDKEIKEKSLVLRYNNALDNRFDVKFERRWQGPFIVKKAFTGGYYQLMDLNGKEHRRKVNGYRLKPYLSRILPAVFETKQVSKKTKKIESNIEVKVVEQPRILTKEPGHDQQVAHDVDTFRKEMQEVVGLMKNLSVHMMGGGRGQGYGYRCGYGSNEGFAGGRGRGMVGRGDMFQCYNCGQWGHKSPQCDKPKRMGGDMFPLPSQIPSRAQDFGIEIQGEAGPSGLTAEEKGKTKVVNIIRLDKGFSPFHLVFGKEALLPIEVEIPALKMMLKFEEENHDALKERLLYLQCLQLDRALALEHYEQVLKTSQAKANSKVKDKGIKKGDMVLHYNRKLDSTFQKKFQIKWQGPFLVLDRFPNGTYQLADLNGTLHKARVNSYRLKKYYARLMVVIEDEPSFEESADMVADCEEIMKTSSFALQALFTTTGDHE